MTTLSPSDPEANRHASAQVPGWSRRRFLQAASATAMGAAMATAVSLPSSTSAGAATADPLAGDDVAATYYRVLLRHTRWAETQWDDAAGYYKLTDFSFAVVLGNALLLTRGTYDADIAGIDRDTLERHTLATLEHFAASNRLTGGSEWGKTLFFDTTFQLYFQLAGRLLWDRLDADTRRNLDTIARAQADYTAGLGTADDPLSGSWTPNGLAGGYVGDTKLEEMGVYAQSLAPGLAWAPDDPDAGAWREWFGRWSRNETGLPPADAANPAVVDGVAVSANTARNLYDTFLVENHGSFGPHYQCELWRTSARNSVHFLTADQPLPQVLTEQPNGTQLWHSILDVMSDSGEPLMPMVADREHLYGRDVIPLAFLAQVLGDPSAAWAEAALAERLTAYQAYPPVDRITKFSGEPKYEPEARAEVAISYLLHEWRARTQPPVHALSKKGVFRAATRATDFGTGPGLVSHQNDDAWAGVVTKPGFVKFAWQPEHDDWFLRISASTPMFLPSTALTVRSRTVRTYSQLRDGFAGATAVLAFDSGSAGFASLPGGAVVYATTGVADAEGPITVQNLTMPGVAGLDGDRTYTAAEGTVTVRAADATTPPGTGAARADDLTLDQPVTARWVRMLGVRPAPTYGYSIFELEVRDGATGADLAQGRATSASSADTGHDARLATDGDAATRWAVSRADRLRADSWLAVDLGAPTSLDRVRISWEAAAGRAYEIQVSDDGTTWTSVAAYPRPDLSSAGGWLCVDDRAGFVVRGSTNPITVVGDQVTLSDGPAAGAGALLVEGRPGIDARATASFARQPAASADTLRVTMIDDHVVAMNLAATAVTEAVHLPQPRGRLVLHSGSQRVEREGTALDVALAGADAVVLPPRFELSSAGGGNVAIDVIADVLDGRSVRLAGTGTVVVRCVQDGSTRTVQLRRQARTITFAGAQPYPVADLALGRTTFPTDPLPAGMSDPGAAVDGDRTSTWRPGADGRMVVDLGSSQALSAVRLAWRGRSPAVRIEASDDGLDYRTLGTLDPGRSELATTASARYVAVAVINGTGSALRSLTVTPA